MLNQSSYHSLELVFMAMADRSMKKWFSEEAVDVSWGPFSIFRLHKQATLSLLHECPLHSSELTVFQTGSLDLTFSKMKTSSLWIGVLRYSFLVQQMNNEQLHKVWVYSLISRFGDIVWPSHQIYSFLISSCGTILRVPFHIIILDFPISFRLEWLKFWFEFLGNILQKLC